MAKKDIMIVTPPPPKPSIKEALVEKKVDKVKTAVKKQAVKQTEVKK